MFSRITSYNVCYTKLLRKHPYTQGLLNCIPVPSRTQPGQMLEAIPGVVPSLIGDLKGCAFANRCSEVCSSCYQANPMLDQLNRTHAVRCPVMMEAVV